MKPSCCKPARGAVTLLLRPNAAHLRELFLPAELCFRIFDITAWFSVATGIVTIILTFYRDTLHLAGDPAFWIMFCATIIQAASGIFRGWSFMRRFQLLSLGLSVEFISLAVAAGITPNWVMPVLVLLLTIEIFLGSRAAYTATAAVLIVHGVIGWGWVEGYLPFSYSPQIAVGTSYDFRSVFAWCRALGFATAYMLLLLMLVRYVLATLRGALDATTGALMRLTDEQKERARATDALFVSQQKFAAAFNSSPMAMSISRLSDGKIIEANEKTAVRYGLTQETIRGKLSTEIGIWDSKEEREQMFEAFRTHGRIKSWLKETRRSDGRRLVVTIAAEPIVIDGEDCVISTSDDITELIETQEQASKIEHERNELMQQLFVAQKLEAVGQLAGGVAHDFNNLLLAIMLHLDVLKLDYSHIDGLGTSIDQLMHCAKRAANLTRQLLLFSRREPVQRQIVELNGLVASLYTMLRRLIETNIDLVQQQSPEKVYIHADPGMIEQVVMNLVINARDAIEDSGKISISIGEELVTEPRSGAIPLSRNGKFGTISCTDTGSGMSAETRSKIFEPFFTTKEVGKGTGLGLATVLGIVEQHDGWIEVETEVGAGTTFRVFFPEHLAGTEEGDTGRKLVGKSASGHETILVVEDDDSVRHVTAAVLRNAGYNVVEANCGPAAISAVHSGVCVDLMLTDIVMPGGMLGHQLATKLFKHGIKPRIIFMSGHNPNREESGMELGVHIAKPFSAEEILVVVRQELDRSPLKIPPSS